MYKKLNLLQNLSLHPYIVRSCAGTYVITDNKTDDIVAFFTFIESGESKTIMASLNFTIPADAELVSAIVESYCADTLVNHYGPNVDYTINVFTNCQPFGRYGPHGRTTNPVLYFLRPTPFPMRPSLVTDNPNRHIQLDLYRAPHGEYVGYFDFVASADEYPTAKGYLTIGYEVILSMHDIELLAQDLLIFMVREFGVSPYNADNPDEESSMVVYRQKRNSKPIELLKITASDIDLGAEYQVITREV